MIVAWILLPVLGIAGTIARRLGVRAIQVNIEPESTQALIPTDVASAAEFDLVTGGKQFDQAASRTAKVLEVTSDPICGAAERAPFVGGLVRSHQRAHGGHE